MKDIAINGSPKAHGNTAAILDTAAQVLAAEGIETEILHIGHRAIRGCIGCGQCAKNKNLQCVLPDDGVNEAILAMKDADGLILGAPVFFAAIPGTMKCFLDRVFYVSGSNGNLFRHKVGASVVADRRAGAVPTFNQLNNYINYAEMFMPSSNYWNVTYGTVPGDVAQDLEGQQIVRVLAKNMAWLLKTQAASTVAKPDQEKKAWFNYVR